MVTDAGTRTGALRVLHVIHGLGSGVEGVVLEYAAATPEHEHHVLFSVDESCHHPVWERSPAFASSTRVVGGLAAFGRAVTDGVRRLRPDLVHAHSSVAGGVTRLVVGRTPIVYTPHCYAFLRQDVGPATRFAFRTVEQLLARHTTAVAACSPHEATLGRGLLAEDRVHYVPNLAARRDLPPRSTSAPDANRLLTIVTSGRISAQKGVLEYAEMATALLRPRAGQRPALRIVWIGGGDERLTEVLRRAGVVVTGWLEQDRALDVLATGDLYVHCAQWEAAPLTVLEAARADVPLIVRDGDALRALGLTSLWSTPAELLRLVREFLADPTSPALHEANRSLCERHTPEAQASALRACYAQASATAPQRSGRRAHLTAVASS